MVNMIWLIFIACGIVYSIITNNVEVVNNTIIDSSKVSLDMLVQIFPVLALWMGLMKIASESGLLNKFSNLISPVLTKLFPEVPKGHESLSYIASNIIANVFGLGSAATPFGLKAMASLQSINKDKKVASRSMVTFLIINTSGVTLVPTTIISMRMMYNSTDPTSILLACILGTGCSMIGGIIVDKIFTRWYYR